MARLALSMIVKNAASDLAECLASARGVVDEIVVADTGSTDASLEIARSAGARTLTIGWEDHFAKARNLSLAEVTADWVLMMDADERLDPAAGKTIPWLISQKEVAGYQVTIRNYVLNPLQKIWDRTSRPNNSGYSPAKKYPAYIDHENVRLFRHSPEIYFTGRVHETVGWRIRDTGGKLGVADFCIHHFGMVRDEAALAKKIVFYRDLGRKKLEDMPENAQAHLEIGIVELENLGNPSGALECFERACQLNPRFGVAWYFAGKAQFHLGQFANAAYSMERAEAAGHAQAAVAELAGDANYNTGDYDAAAACYRRALKRAPGNASLESKLGLAETRAGAANAGLKKLRRAIRNQPDNPDLYDRLMTVEIWLNHLSEGADVAERKIRMTTPYERDFVRAASIRAQLKEWERAAKILREGLVVFPSAEALQANLRKVEEMISTASAAADERVTRQIFPRSKS
jgi:tetratricopeptide (TPR) repeat protein